MDVKTLKTDDLSVFFLFNFARNTQEIFGAIQ